MDIDPTMKFFAYRHLPERLRKVSKMFHDLAHELIGAAPNCEERRVALRKLLESKDAAVRAALEDQ